ncbi:MAG: T9SS type A sorting domain-containing protein, partial [Chitinophagaceae bacterium]
VRVRPMPYLNAISSTRLCAGSSAAFPLTGLRDSVAWTNSNPLIGLASAGFGAIPSFVLENSDTISRAGTLSALPWILGCPGTAAGFTVTVNPKPVLSAPGNVVTCNSKSTTITPFSANMIASTYTWTGSIASIGLASSGTGQIPTFTAQNNTMAALTDTIRATPSVIVGGLSCAGSAGLFTIKVNAASSGTFSYAGSPYCANTGNASFTGTLGGGGVFSAGAGLSINSSTGVINLGTSIEGDYTVTYSVTAANSGGCNALSTSADVRVKRNPLVVAPSNVVLCSGDALNVNFGQDSANNLDRSYTWAANSNVAGIGPSGTGNMSGIAVTNAGSSTIIDTITVQGTNGGLVYVSQANGQLLTLNPTTLTKTVILSTADSGRGLWASRGGQYLYLAHGTKVSAINMATGALSYNYQGSMSMNMIFETPGRRSLYLGYNNAYSNSQIEKVLAPIFAFKRLSTASKPVYGMAMATDTNKLYSTFIGGPSIRIVNNTTRSNEYVITRSYPFDLAISNTKNRLYISHSTLPAISVLNTVTNMIVDTIPLPGNGSQLLMNADGSRLYVAMPNLNSIAVVRSSDSSLLTTIALGAQPSSMALSSDGASLFVTTTVSPYTFFEVSTVTNTVTRTTTTGLPGFFHAVTVSPGCTNPTATFTITVKPTPSGSFQYSSSPYCRNAGLATTTGTLTSGGIYTAAAGLSINDSTGTVNLAASTPGTYTVEYTMAASGACATFTTSAMITIKEVPVMVHTATQAICSGGISADVSFSSSMINSSFAWTGSTALAGLLSSGNGNIPSFTTTNNTAAVLVDTILVRATNDGCQGAADTIYFRVTPLPLATIAYDAQQFCAQGSAQVSRTGTAGGVYSSSTGLSIDASTGAVNLATSTAGTYTVTYTVGASGGCSLFATTTSITINAYSTWTGAADRNWSNAANWCGVLPTSSTDVLVPVVPNQPIVYTTATVRNLTVQTGTSLMVQGSLSLYGNLANSGGSIDMSMGTLNLEGSQLQQVPAFAATNVNVKGGGGFTLAGSSTVSGTLSFSASGGFITLGSYNLSAGTITGGSATGFVVTNGTGRLTVRSVGIATTVPIGVASNSFSPLVVNSPEGLDWSVRVQPDFSGYTAINSGFALPRVWVVTPTQTPTLLPAQITFTYPNSVWATPATVNVFHYGAATGWQLSGSNGAALSSTLNGNLRSVVLSRQQQFSPFAIGGAGVDLPVTLLGFTGQRLRDRNHLKWITATEVNSLGFDVERSMDGRRFLALEFVASASIDGNSSTQLPYSYVDASALQQSYYYRLKLIDRDGRYRFSPVLHLQTGKEEGLRITQLYPNPARQSTSVQLSSPVGYDLQVTLLDANGQLARLKNISVGPGASVFTLPLDGLAAGVYLLQVSGPAGVKSEVLKVFKE